MAGKAPKLPEISNIFDLAPIQTGRIPIEWVIDNTWIGRIKDEEVIKTVTKIKMDYITKVAELENQMRTLQSNMRKDLARAVGI
jgi:hypothetical protein